MQKFNSVAALIAFTVLPSACGGVEGHTASQEDSIQLTTQTNPNTDPDLSTTSGPQCADPKIMFDGECRRPKFFERFLTEGAELQGVFGNQHLNSTSGVSVLELTAPGIFQLTSIDPPRPDGQPVVGRHQRAGYPVTSIMTYAGYIDEDGFVNSLEIEYGTIFGQRVSFGVKSWRHRVYTISGYIEYNESGSTEYLPGSGGGTEGLGYCFEKAGNAGEYVKLACGGVGIGLSGWAAHMTFASIAVPAGGSSVLAGGTLSAGGTISASVFAGGVAGTAFVCNAMGEAIEHHFRAECFGAPDVEEPKDPRIQPAEGSSSSDYSQGSCEEGFVQVQGEVQYCTENEFTVTTGGTNLSETTTSETEINCFTMSVGSFCMPLDSF